MPMKLIVTGATGFVGTEVLRLALANPSITSVVALARKRVLAPQNIPGGGAGDASKLHSVMLDDWEADEYPSTVADAMRDADACIWTLAVTPSKSRSMDFADVTRICDTYTRAGLANLAKVANRPFRFVFVSGVMIERDQSASLNFAGEYRKMRGRTETHILEFAAARPDAVQATCAKPGFIDGPGRVAAGMLSSAARVLQPIFGGATPSVHVSELAAALIEQATSGITKDPLNTDDLAQAGKRILKKDEYLK